MKMKTIVLFLIMLFSVSAFAEVPEVPEPDLNFEYAEVVQSDVIAIDAFVVSNFLEDPGLEIEQGIVHSFNSTINLDAEIRCNQAGYKQDNKPVKPTLSITTNTATAKNNFKNLLEDPGWCYS